MPEAKTHRFIYQLPEDFSDFDPRDFISQCRRWFWDTADSSEVAISVSGGVDSTAAAFLLKDALGGKNVYPFFIEDGARRVIRGKPEWQIARDMFSEFPYMEILFEEDRFMPKMESVSDGEAKRKIFIGEYRDISNQYLKKLGVALIADGTIAPDIRETEGRVKSQHNVGWDYSHDKLEPLASLSKPHVRKVAIELGLPPEFAHRIPCPGPAQWLRTVGAPSPEKMELAQLATEYVEEAVEEWCLRNWGARYRYSEETGVREPFQYFAAVLDPGMERWECDAGKCLNQSVRFFMTRSKTTCMPEAGKRPEKPIYGPVVWVRGELDNADFVEHHRMGRMLWDQFRVPRMIYDIGGDPDAAGYPVVIRAIMSTDVKECQPMGMDFEYLRFVAKGLRARGAGPVGYDISTKPPATVEFE